MGWWGGEWIEGRKCEDAPCCGCCGPAVERAESAYWDERAMEPDHGDNWGENEYGFCDDCGEWEEDCECESESDYRDDDSEHDAEVLASAGWGTDEDYGYFGGDDY